MPDDGSRELTTDPGLVEVLDRARRLGFTGDASAADQITHALRFIHAARRVADDASGTGVVAVDLGSGAGLPGLVLATALPASHWVLVEAMARRADPLRQAVSFLGLLDRVEVWVGRAEMFARESGRRGSVTLVTARGFAAPAPTAECAAPLLRVGGILAVSEPPDSDGTRWPEEELRQLGLAPEGVHEGVMVCRATAPCPPTYPRRVGLPAKRPLF